MRRLSLGRKVVYASTAIIFVLLGLELTARVILAVRPRRSGEHQRSAVTDRLHPLRYDLAPGSTMPANGPLAKINEAGLRGVFPERPKRRMRVLCLGDSCTFGFAPDVTDETTYPAALGRVLDRRRFEVLNGGRPGFGSLDCLGFFVHEAVELHPDVVVILTGWNDYANAHPLRMCPPPPDTLGVLDHSALFRLEREAVKRLAAARAANLTQERARLRTMPPSGDGLSELVFSRTKRVIADLVRLCRAHGCTPILVTYPNFTRPDWNGVDSLSDAELRPALSHLARGELSPRGCYRYASETNSLIRAVADELTVPLVDGETIRDPALFHDFIHLNARGCEALAKRVAGVVREVNEPKGGPS